MATNSVLLNVTATTTAPQILNVLRDLYHKAFSGGGIYPSAGPYTGYGVVYDDIATNSRFFAKTDTVGLGSADDIAWVEIGIVSNKLYQRIWTGFNVIAGVAPECLTASAVNWAGDIAGGQENGTYCNVYFGESFLIYAAADRGFAWFNIKSSLGTQYPCMFAGTNKVAGDTKVYSAATSRTWRYGKVNGSVTRMFPPELGGEASGSNNTYTVIYLLQPIDGTNKYKVAHKASAVTSFIAEVGSATQRTDYPVYPQLELIPVQSKRVGRYLKHPDDAVLAAEGCQYDFGTIMGIAQIMGDVPSDTVFPSVASPQWISTPDNTGILNVAIVRAWSVPVLHNL